MKRKALIPLILLALSFLSFVSTETAYANTIVNGCQNTGASVTSLTCALTHTSGNNIIVIEAMTSTNCGTTPSDGGDTFTPITPAGQGAPCYTPGGSNSIEVWHSVAPTSGSVTIQCNYSTNTNVDSCYAFDVSGDGGDTIPSLGFSQTATTSILVNSFTPTANSLILAVVSVFSQTGNGCGTPGYGSGYSGVSPASACRSNQYGMMAEQEGGWSGSTTTTSPMTPPNSATVTFVELAIQIAPPPTVSQTIQCTMDNSGTPQATLTLSGGSPAPSPSTVLCDGGSHSVTVEGGATITATEPSDGANSRYRFSGGGTTTTHTGAADTWTITNYLELQQTYQLTPNIPNQWDQGYSETPVGTVAGAGSTTICTITLNGGGGSATCNGWSDYNRNASVLHSFASGQAGRSWVATTGTHSWSDTTGGNTHNVLYGLQNSVSVTLTVAAQAQTNFDTGMHWKINGTESGSAVTLCTITSSAAPTDSCTAFPDFGTLITFPRYASVPPANSQWQAQPPYKITAPASGTVTVNYYKQWEQTAKYSWVCVVGDTCTGAPSETYVNITASVTLSLTTSPQTYYSDANAKVTITPTLTDAQKDMYSTSPTSWTITAANQVGNPSVYGLFATPQTVVGWLAPDSTHWNNGIGALLFPLLGAIIMVMLGRALDIHGDSLVSLYLTGVTMGAMLGMLTLGGVTTAGVVPFALPVVAGIQLVLWIWRSR